MNIVKKCLRKFISAVKNIRDIPKDTKEFGLKIAIVKYRRSLGLISVHKYIDIITQKTKIEIEPILKKYQEGQVVGLKKHVDFKDKIPVFVSWLQGEDSMPEWCRACYNNIKRILPSQAELVFITYDNLSTYVQIPKNIIQKLGKGEICVTNFSDIVRNALLATYGGGWIDLAIYLSKGVFESAFQYDLYTPRFGSEKGALQDVSRGRWVLGCWITKKPNILFQFVYDSLVLFWEKHNRMLDYLYCDYIIWNGYLQIDAIKDILDAVPVNNKEIRLLNSLFEEEFSQELFEDVLNKQSIHLVDRHKNYKTEKNGKETTYGHILKINNNK